jgi:BSD domain
MPAVALCLPFHWIVANVQVPLTVSNNDFWRRYYFRIHLLDEEEARRVELMKRAENVQGDNEKEIGWEDEGSFLFIYLFF